MGVFSEWILKTKILEGGIEVSLQAVRTLGRSSGSLMKNFISAVCIAWASS